MRRSLVDNLNESKEMTKLLRGVSFEENNAENVFRALDTAMNTLSYDWYIDDVDLNYFYFRSGKYDGQEFKNALDVISRLSFARIRRYPAGAPIDCIDEYEDFVKSECDFLMLFYDGGFFEIFEKEERVILKTMDFCLNFGFENAEYIYDAEDSRSYMHF